MLFDEHLDKKIDIVTIFNSYRDFNEDLQKSLLKWCQSNCTFFICPESMYASMNSLISDYATPFIAGTSFKLGELNSATIWRMR